jgi:hypothetical protein
MIDLAAVNQGLLRSKHHPHYYHHYVLRILHHTHAMNTNV